MEEKEKWVKKETFQFKGFKTEKEAREFLEKRTQQLKSQVKRIKELLKELEESWEKTWEDFFTSFP